MPKNTPFYRYSDKKDFVIITVGNIGHAAVPALITTLKDNDDWAVKWETARALGNIGSAAKTAIPYLIMALKDDNDEVSNEARRALNKIRRK